MSSRCAVLVLSLVIFHPAFASEAVYFNSGFCLKADSHAVQDQRLVLRIGTGTLEFPVTEVSRIELLPDPPNKPVVSSPALEQRPEELVTNAANTEQLPPEFVRSVAKVESGFRQNAVSRKGALGLMQLMPATATELGVDATRAPENAKGGAKYLRDLLIRYRGDSALALAAYNAGPGAVSKFRGVPPYPETRRYVLQVLREYERQKSRAKLEVEVKTPASKPIATD
ncbi:MAG: lytic transglycosylase domain-containing protein [Acidobacteriaceae bacterium]|nr:lytic transglycosylase domain-containing protein [Acidobacteriaceae bacterium]MBV9296934.1 lytic transglycosylase domain-containing protein [Acidobacteriaceae bacterium]MBV9765578.1 lytic transglycosylase domain-containing protein [Acidobacteriaceae bacterium]